MAGSERKQQIPVERRPGQPEPLIFCDRYGLRLWYRPAQHQQRCSSFGRAVDDIDREGTGEREGNIPGNWC
jgi:hypothetical protein